MTSYKLVEEDSLLLKDDDNYEEEHEDNEEDIDDNEIYFSLLKQNRHTKSQLLNHETSVTDYSEFHKKETQVDKSFPRSVFFIIGNEFCERFSYYGLRTILALYLIQELRLSEDKATVYFHIFSMLCYLTPLFGALLADSLLGRFRTILYISILYLFGNLLISVSAVPIIFQDISQRKTISFIGLLLVAFGTGGIKPCVSAFGGDQFVLPHQERQLTKFFSVFYFSINAGSLLSTLLTPILREDVSCFGGDCFALAFGVPAALMVLSVVFFTSGTPQYRIVPPEGNVAGQVVSCVAVATYRRLRHSEPPLDHWLDHAGGHFPPGLIADVKRLLQVLLLFLPLPFFWTLFDQQGSRWTFQATRMSGHIGSMALKPDQMQASNPILILILIPLFESLVYPTFGVLKKPLNRMVIGGFMAALAFVASGILQIQIQKASTSSISCSRVINVSPCDLKCGSKEKENVVFAYEQMLLQASISSNSSSIALHCSLLQGRTSVQQCTVNGQQNSNAQHTVTKPSSVLLNTYLGSLHAIVIDNSEVHSVVVDDESMMVRFLDTTSILRLSDLRLVSETTEIVEVSAMNFSKGVSWTEWITLKAGRYNIYKQRNSDENYTLIDWIQLEEDSVHNILLYEGFNNKLHLKVLPEVSSEIHMLWLLPQYILISVGEIMFSISGIEFSFKQAPSSMKSVVQAAWLLTVSLGNLIVVVVAETQLFSNQTTEFFLFALLMAVDMLVFCWLAHRYERTNTTQCLPPSLSLDTLTPYGGSEEEEEHIKEHDEEEIDVFQMPKSDS